MKLFMTLFLSLSIVSTSFAASESKTLKFATEATYAPLVYIDKSGKISGFEAEIVQALCGTMQNVTCQLNHQGWDSLIPSIKLGKVDAIFGGLAITPERSNQVSFTQPLYENAVGIITKKEASFSINEEGLANKTIGVQLGTTMENYLHEKYSKVKVKSYASLQDALLDIQSGRIDAVLGDTPVLATWMKEKPVDQYVITKMPAAEIAHFGPGNAIAVNKNNKVLLQELNAAITQIKENGTLEKISAKYGV